MSATKDVSARARLLAAFVVLFIILGGGGSPNPLTEVILQFAFVLVALAWLWFGAGPETGKADPIVWLLAVIVLLIPVVQLIPLPPSVWTSFPGRANEIAALKLVDGADTWRPVSMAPARTFAALLASLPAIFCLYAMSRMRVRERNLILAAIVGMVVVSALLGMAQLASGAGLNLYGDYSRGWVTGFQANRNAAADVMLAGFLAIVALAMPYLVDPSRKIAWPIDRQALLALAAGCAVLLFIATIMTGSRTGTALMLLALLASFLMFLVLQRGLHRSVARPAYLFGPAILVAAFAVYFIGFSQNTAIGRVASRFWGDGNRLNVWEDTWFALGQYWPLGFGLGGFQAAMLPAERLEYLDRSIPNRAHNEYLEIGLEAGALGYLAVFAAAAVCLYAAFRLWRAEPALRHQVIFGVATLLVIAFHSIVDYPLRTMAVACIAGLAAGCLTRPPHEALPRQSATRRTSSKGRA